MHKTSPEVGGMGHAIKRKEDLRFIQGRGNYVDDINLPHMVYGQLVRSPYAHARIKSINTAKAKAVPGVLAIVTGEDLAKANLAWMPTLSGDKQMVLATGKVLFQVEHEMRCLKHASFNRTLVNRNPYQNANNKERGLDAFKGSVGN